MQRRNTNQRKIIYEIVKSTNIHPTADWIYEKARLYIPNALMGVYVEGEVDDIEVKKNPTSEITELLKGKGEK